MLGKHKVLCTRMCLSTFVWILSQDILESGCRNLPLPHCQDFRVSVRNREETSFFAQAPPSRPPTGSQPRTQSCLRPGSRLDQLVAVDPLSVKMHQKSPTAARLLSRVFFLLNLTPVLKYLVSLLSFRGVVGIVELWH